MESSKGLLFKGSQTKPFIRHGVILIEIAFRRNKVLDSSQGGQAMKLNPPKMITFWISIVLGVLGFLGRIVTIPFISTYDFWFLFIGFLLLVLGLLIKGL